MRSSGATGSACRELSGRQRWLQAKSRSSSESQSGRACARASNASRSASVRARRRSLALGCSRRRPTQSRGQLVGRVCACPPVRSLEPSMEPRPARQQSLVRDLSRFLASIRAGRIGASEVLDEDKPVALHIRQRLSKAQRPSVNSRLRATRRVGPAVPSSRARRIKRRRHFGLVRFASQHVLEARARPRVPRPRLPGLRRCRPAQRCRQTRDAAPRLGSARTAQGPDLRASRRHPEAHSRPALCVHPAQRPPSRSGSVTISRRPSSVMRPRR